jgi:hypothetical protein
MSVMITWLARTLDPSLQGVAFMISQKEVNFQMTIFNSNRDGERKPFSNHLILSKNKSIQLRLNRIEKFFASLRKSDSESACIRRHFLDD